MSRELGSAGTDLVRSAMGSILTGMHPFSADPFRSDLEVVGEELLVATPGFARRLATASGSSRVDVFAIDGGDDGSLVVGDGWELELRTDADSWYDEASSVDLTLNGLQFLFLGTGWAVFVLPDAELVGGPKEFTDAFFGSEADKVEADEVFRNMALAPEAYTGLGRLVSYVRFAERSN